ncbi:MAG: hypothetical protein ABJA93_13485, partial [Sporichthyaceae bacterium]
MTWSTPVRSRAAAAPVRAAFERLRRLDAVAVVGVCLWVLLSVVVLANSHGVLVVDIKPEVYLAPWRSFRAYLSPWEADPQLGFPSFNV